MDCQLVTPLPLQARNTVEAYPAAVDAAKSLERLINSWENMMTNSRWKFWHTFLLGVLIAMIAEAFNLNVSVIGLMAFAFIASLLVGTVLNYQSREEKCND